MAAYEFPVADFSWLGNIPRVAEEAKQRQARQSLADMSSEFDLNTTSGLSSAAKKALSQGLFDEANRFLAAAQAKRSSDIQAARDSQYAQFVAPTIAALMGKGGIPGGAVAAPQDEGAGASVPFGRGAPAPAPDVFANPVSIGPKTFPPGGLPGAAPPARPPAPAPRAPDDLRTEIPPSLNAPPSPTEQVLSAAEGPAPAAPAPVQLAGPPPTPDTAPTAAPSWLAGAQAPIPTPAPPTAPPTRPLSGTVDPAQTARIQQLEIGMASLGPRASPSQRQALAEQLKAELAKTSWSPEMKAYRVDQADRFAAGEPTQPISDWKQDQILNPKRAEQASQAYEKSYRAEGLKAQNIRDTVDQLNTIVKDPSFATSGFGSAMMDKMQSGLAGLAGQLRAMGIPTLSEDTINSLTKPAALRQAFSALASQSLVAGMGGLGAGKSDRDVLVYRSIGPQLSNVPGGNELIIEFMSKIADRKDAQAKTAQDYLDAKGNRATIQGMDKAVQDQNMKFRENGILMDKDGNLTDLGRRMRDAAQPPKGRASFPFSSERILTGPSSARPTPGLIGSPDYYRGVGTGEL